MLLDGDKEQLNLPALIYRATSASMTVTRRH
jgi:hypothetical protein